MVFLNYIICGCEPSKIRFTAVLKHLLWRVLFVCTVNYSYSHKQISTWNWDIPIFNQSLSSFSESLELIPTQLTVNAFQVPACGISMIFYILSKHRLPLVFLAIKYIVAQRVVSTSSFLKRSFLKSVRNLWMWILQNAF